MADEDRVAGGAPSYGDIAKRLLDDRLLLTALELHYELVEAGKELPGLREFFSDPSNFEHSSPQNDNISMTLSMGMYNRPFPVAYSDVPIFFQHDRPVRRPWTRWR